MHVTTRTDRGRGVQEIRAGADLLDPETRIYMSPAWKNTIHIDLDQTDLNGSSFHHHAEFEIRVDEVRAIVKFLRESRIEIVTIDDVITSIDCAMKRFFATHTLRPERRAEAKERVLLRISRMLDEADAANRLKGSAR